MGLFDFFKKKEEPRVERTLRNMQKGDIVDYFLKSWEVKSVGEYDWGNNIYSREYELDAGDEQLFLHVTADLKCSITKEVSVNKVNPELKKHIVDRDEPMQQFVYLGAIYYLSESGQGYFTEDGGESSRFVSWDFVSQNEKQLVSISRWGEMDIEAFAGEFVDPIEFSNIIPKS